MHSVPAASVQFNLHSSDIKLRYFFTFKLRIIQIQKLYFLIIIKIRLHNIYTFKDLQLFYRYAIYLYHTDYIYIYIYIYIRNSQRERFLSMPR